MHVSIPLIKVGILKVGKSFYKSTILRFTSCSYIYFIIIFSYFSPVHCLSLFYLLTICACKISVIILIKISKWNLSHYLQHWSHTMTPIKASSSPSSLLTITICQRYKNRVRFRIFQFKSAFL